jgi:hypothetical protein
MGSTSRELSDQIKEIVYMLFAVADNSKSKSFRMDFL